MFGMHSTCTAHSRHNTSTGQIHILSLCLPNVLKLYLPVMQRVSIVALYNHMSIIIM